ncbi:beta-2-microglobulin-like [Megalops cyprinoides]|uniref:beta-2-microglobulin-like n=1 Tax=Megalops cyprinoides TaxID=118141 RepID=UPI001863DE69|nr:beta-2-microglobulin-like [Megalops cyprinoides]XP_036376042.1 beta-2-microglobulin-like [Megalops cyprinoides]
MKFYLAAVVLIVALFGVNAKTSPPKVQVYSRNPGEFGKSNTLICHVSGFHPPDISITLLKDGVEIPKAKQTDLAFEQSWQFHLTKSVPFTPEKGETYSCKVRHMQDTKNYNWEPDM